jgi:hypothetical protein
MALIEFDGGGLQELEDAKTLKAVMFLMIQEITKSTPNDQELGGRIRNIINNYEKDVNRNLDIDTI